MANILPPFPSFSVHEDDASVGPIWKKWLKRFQMYLAAHHVKDPTRNRALLLCSAGEEVSDIFETLPHQGEEKEYEKAVAALNAYFQPKVNKTYETYMFRNATHNPGESLDSYCTRLRRLAQTSRSTSKKVNTVDKRDGDESTDEEYTYRITLHSVRDKVQPLTEVIIEDKTVKCLIDSGAGVNVIDSCSFNQLENVHLLPTSKKIYGYRSTEPLPVVGKFEAEVKASVTSKSKGTQFRIVDGSDGNLIGCQTATDLGLLHTVNSVSTP